MTSHDLAYSQRSGFSIDYGREAEEEIVRLQALIQDDEGLIEQYPSRWLAIKLLEGDPDIQMRLKVSPEGRNILASAEQSIAHLNSIFNDDVDVVIADHRYGWINGLVKEAVKRTREDRLTVSDKIDKVLTSRIFGLPIFLFAMWVIFKLTADVSGPYLEWINSVVGGPFANWITTIFGLLGLSESWVVSLFVDGIIAGVGGVLAFVPVMMFLYLALAILEDSGYMARAAFVMDGLMHVLGMHGKSFLPMMVGFGCTVPALYATRTLENEKDRIMTGLLVPFMSCGARLPVYVLFAAIFFPKRAGLVVFSLYLLGIITAIVLGLVLKNTVFKGKEQSAFVMELPPYRIPTLKSIWSHMWERTSEFVRKAWSLILVTSVILWFLTAIPVGGTGQFAEINVGDSAFASVSNVISPILKPLGFGSWETSGALVSGFVAKEVVVTTLTQVHGLEEPKEEVEQTTFFEDIGEIVTSFIRATGDTIKSLPLIVGINLFEEEAEEDQTALMGAVQDNFEETSNGHGALAALAFMVFVLLYTPCVAAVAAERQELGGKWTWLSVFGQFVLAWIMAFIVFQGGILLGFG